MSTADVAVPAALSQPAAVARWLRLLRSELRLTFGRKRNLVLLAVLAACLSLPAIASAERDGSRCGAVRWTRGSPAG